MERVTYTDHSGQEYDAVQLSWAEVRTILGHDATGSPEEEQALITWMLDHGAPEWIRGASGWTDEHGWGLISPTPMIMVFSGKVWWECPLVELGTVEATPQAVADLANVSVEVAQRALSQPGEPVLAGWAVEADIRPTPDPTWVEVGESRYGDAVFAPSGAEDDPFAVIEPFYVMVER